jgi:hypothetical protein
MVSASCGVAQVSTKSTSRALVGIAARTLSRSTGLKNFEKKIEVFWIFVEIINFILLPFRAVRPDGRGGYFAMLAPC